MLNVRLHLNIFSFYVLHVLLYFVYDFIINNSLHMYSFTSPLLHSDFRNRRWNITFLLTYNVVYPRFLSDIIIIHYLLRFQTCTFVRRSIQRPDQTRCSYCRIFSPRYQHRASLRTADYHIYCCMLHSHHNNTTSSTKRNVSLLSIDYCIWNIYC